MKVIITIILFFLSLSLQASQCDESSPLRSYRPQFAKHFEINYYKNYKIIKVDSRKYILSSNNVDCDTDELPIKTPVVKVVMTSTTYLPALLMLNQEKTLIGFQNKKYIVSKKFDLEKIKEISYKFNAEDLLAFKADLIMGYEANLLNGQQEKVFKKLNIPIVINKDFEEATPLGRAEWIVFIGSFFDQDQKAIEMFESIKNAYLKLKKENESRTYKTKVIVGDIQNGFWVTCGGKSDLAQMIRDAGGVLGHDRPSSSTQNISLEEISKDATKYDVWLPQNNWKTLEDKKDKRYGLITAKKIFNNNLITNDSMANDYWETGMQRPDLLLMDLSMIFHLDDYKKQNLHWYHQL